MRGLRKRVEVAHPSVQYKCCTYRLDTLRVRDCSLCWRRMACSGIFLSYEARTTPFRISKRTGLQWGNKEPFLQLVTLEKARTVREDNVDMQVVHLTGCDKSGGSW